MLLGCRIMNIFIDTLEFKKKLRERISSHLSNDEISNARSDWHTKRRPRHCGLTIHTGVGCPYQCIYCYIYSMGFPIKISRYSISPPSIIYALLCNEYFVPTINGTFLALGSVTEPFHPLTRDFTLELIHLINKYLGNPTQASTKAYMPEEYIKNLVNANPRLSLLYTFTTIHRYKRLEPYAPAPYKRLESIDYLIKYGIHTALFVRPIIPGITDRENNLILKHGAQHGVDKVVYGSLRISKDILKRLLECLEPTIIELIKQRIRSGKIGNKQRYIYMVDIKNRLIEEAKKLGFKIFPSACSANIDAIRRSCYMCNFGPCGDSARLPEVSESDIIEFMEYLGVDNKKYRVYISSNIVYMSNFSLKEVAPWIIEHIKILSKRKLILSPKPLKTV